MQEKRWKHSSQNSEKEGKGNPDPRIDVRQNTIKKNQRKCWQHPPLPIEHLKSPTNFITLIKGQNKTKSCKYGETSLLPTKLEILVPF